MTADPVLIGKLALIGVCIYYVIGLAAGGTIWGLTPFLRREP